MHTCLPGWLSACLPGWLRWLAGCLSVSVYAFMDGQTDRWMDGYMSGCVVTSVRHAAFKHSGQSLPKLFFIDETECLNHFYISILHWANMGRPKVQPWVSLPRSWEYAGSKPADSGIGVPHIKIHRYLSICM